MLLAFSGGADSVVLAHLLKDNGYKFELAHCNFNLRGKESDLDEKFCVDFAKKIKIKIHVKQFDTKSYVKIKKLSVQMAARELRYHWFNELTNQHHFDFILTAHHANDSIETLLVNLTRGTGINGLQGIPAKQNKIVRPLLYATKTVILNYAETKKIKFRHDSSNDEVKYTRNYLRHKIIPALKKINPSVEQTLLHNIGLFKQSAAIVAEYSAEKRKEIVTEQDGQLKILISPLLKQTSPLVLLHDWLDEYGFNSVQLTQLLTGLEEKLPGKIFYAEKHQLLVDRNFLIVSLTETEKNEEEFELKNINAFKNLPIKLQAKLVKENKVIADKNIGLFDYEKIKFPLTLRKWQNGDKFMPLGMNNFKKVSDFFISNKVPLTEKNKIWILANSNNDIIWIIGYRIDERYKLQPQSEQFLKIEYKTNG